MSLLTTKATVSPGLPSKTYVVQACWLGGREQGDTCRHGAPIGGVLQQLDLVAWEDRRGGKLLLIEPRLQAPHGFILAHHGVAFPMYEEKLGSRHW